MGELPTKETYKPASNSIQRCLRCRAYSTGDTCPICQPTASPTGYWSYGDFCVLPAIKTRALLGKDQPERPTGVRRPLTLLALGTVLFLVALWASIFSLPAYIIYDCRTNCCDANCYTPYVPATPTILPQSASPDQVVQYFLELYNGSVFTYDRLAPLFDIAYANVAPSVFSCAMNSTEQSFGPIAFDSREQPVITGTVASVVAYLRTPLRNDDTIFYLKQEQDGWKIDRIVGWFGRDVTPDNPVGEIQSCLQVTPVVNQPAR